MRILITGGAGFIGSNLCRRLVSMGATVVVLDDLSTGLESNLEDLDVELVEGSILDKDLLLQLGASADALVHLAARGSVPRSIANPVATFDVNSLGTLNVLEAARAGQLHSIVASSSSVYGANTHSPKDERMWTAPLTPYAASKLSSEAFANAYASSYDIPMIVFRPFNVFGPWQRSDHEYAAVIPKWIAKALTSQAIELHGDGEQSRDFTFIDTVVDVLTQAIEQRITHPTPVNLAYGNHVSLNEILAKLTSLTGHLEPVIHAPARPGDIRHSLNDPTLVRSLFPNVQPVDFTEGFTRTLRWMEGIGG